MFKDFIFRDIVFQTTRVHLQCFDLSVTEDW